MELRPGVDPPAGNHEVGRTLFHAAGDRLVLLADAAAGGALPGRRRKLQGNRSTTSAAAVVAPSPNRRGIRMIAPDCRHSFANDAGNTPIPSTPPRLLATIAFEWLLLSRPVAPECDNCH
jgi:hypothetical protein